jgi:D-glycero-alpha-D-manno-heptose-7-phosphate kinase
MTEIVDLKEPIGVQDQYATAFGGLNYFGFTDKRVTVNKVNLEPHEMLYLKDQMHLVYVGGTRSASALLKQQASFSNTPALKILADMAKEAATELHHGDLDSLGAWVRAGWELKREFSHGVSNERIDTIIDTAIYNGATGGKLLGAGGAGFVLLVCPRYASDKMLTALKPLNLHYVPFEFENEGVKVLYED